jgi:hypothetical protein
MNKWCLWTTDGTRDVQGRRKKGSESVFKQMRNKLYGVCLSCSLTECALSVTACQFESFPLTISRYWMKTSGST